MRVNPYEKLEEVINDFLNYLGVNIDINNLSKFEMMFSFNSRDLKLMKDKTVNEAGILNYGKITVIDMRNILGGRENVNEIKNALGLYLDLHMLLNIVIDC